MKHADDAGHRNFVIHSPDTDVFILCLSVLRVISGEVFFKTGVKDKARFIDLQAVKTSIEDRFTSDDCNIDSCLDALIGVFAYTGCDTVSSFAGQDKVKALKLMSKHKKYVDLFCNLGTSWQLQDDIIQELESFTCHLYGMEVDDINYLRYKLYSAKAGKCDIEKLPPCRSALYQHCLRANYQCRIWRLCLVADPSTPSPD